MLSRKRQFGAIAAATLAVVDQFGEVMIGFRG
jgi:hypothetical protein